jgi:hypothetical protein
VGAAKCISVDAKLVGELAIVLGTPTIGLTGVIGSYASLSVFG